jgi:ribosomal protein S18 acetylase RimI-like enzyme
VAIDIEIARHSDSALLDAINRMLPQLSSTASPLEAADLAALITSPSTTLFVARRDDAVVGMLTLVAFAIPTGPRAWIEDVVVDESARGVGVGESLTLAAIDQARLMGVRSIDLTSRPSREAANALYQKLGFERRSTNVYRYLVEE